MVSKSSVSPVAESVPILEIGRAYNATDATAILGISESVLNERVREGVLKLIFPTGDRRYSGYELARLLGWPVSEDPRDYMLGQLDLGLSDGRPISRRRRRLASKQVPSSRRGLVSLALP